MKSYYERNKVEAKRYQKAYYWRNREQILNKRQHERDEDPEVSCKNRAYQRAYYEKNRDQILAKRAAKRRMCSKVRKNRANRAE